MLLIEEPLLNQRRAAFLAARIVGCNRHPEAGGSRGVSDPTSAAPSSPQGWSAWGRSRPGRLSRSSGRMSLRTHHDTKR